MLFLIRSDTCVTEWCFSLLVGWVSGWVSFHSLNMSAWLCKSEPFCVINIPWYGSPNSLDEFWCGLVIAVSCHNTLKFAVYMLVGSRRWKSAEYRCWFVCIHRESHGAKHRPTGLHYYFHHSCLLLISMAYWRVLYICLMWLKALSSVNHILIVLTGVVIPQERGR